MSDQRKVAIIGSGSWATALAKLLLNNVAEINWYVRSEETIEYFQKYHHNPKYISDIEFDTTQIHFFSNISEAIDHADVLVFAVPAPFLKDALSEFTGTLENRMIVSAIKGIVPEENITVAEFFNKNFQIPF